MRTACLLVLLSFSAGCVPFVQKEKTICSSEESAALDTRYQAAAACKRKQPDKPVRFQTTITDRFGCTNELGDLGVMFEFEMRCY